MQDLPAQGLRTNYGTWAVAPAQLPPVTRFMLQALPLEPYDKDFMGQFLETTYFDTEDLDLRQAREKKKKYLTLRLRCYRTWEGNELYALSTKTEDEKYRLEIPSNDADAILSGQYQGWTKLLPSHLQARLNDLVGDGQVRPITTISMRRFAVENETDRFTLDTEVRTNTGKWLKYAVLEFKSTEESQPPGRLSLLLLRPLKISKFLWATKV